MPSGVRRFALAILATIAVALVTTTVAYSGNGGFLPGEPHSPNAHNIHRAFIVVSIFTGIILLGVEAALVVFSVQYRRRNPAPTGDCISSWWVPDLGGKYDALPGRVNKTWFKAPAGTYQAQCYELCGIQHADMAATVEVVPRAQYDSFLATRKSGAGILPLGREEWEGVCTKCHRLDHKYIGP